MGHKKSTLILCLECIHELTGDTDAEADSEKKKKKKKEIILKNSKENISN